MSQDTDVESLDEACTHHQRKGQLKTDESHMEHLRLAEVVKGVHADLRKKYKKNTSDLEQIWYEHCQNKPILSQYAVAMQQLATDHWAKKQETRIDWCREIIQEYFHDGGLQKVRDKDARRKLHEPSSGVHSDMSGANTCAGEPILKGHICQQTKDSDIDSISQNTQNNLCLDADPGEMRQNTEAGEGQPSNKSRKYNTVQLPFEGRVRLLDVGSCFNPFLAYPEIQAVGIDISPATDSVFHCDFLHLRTTDHLQVARDTLSTFINTLKDPVEWLPKECFHVVVFSLLLEYFPAPYQRWLCCEKAQELLMHDGILIIITPDSHAVNRNAPMMKSWKTAIESMGFKRWRYVKQEHLHCVVFRKVEVSEEDKQTRYVNGITADMMFIPQDFNTFEGKEEKETQLLYTAEDEEFYKLHTLTELPVMSDSDDEQKVSDG